MTTIRSAVALLTRLPVASAETARPGAAAFGVIGGLVGVVGAIPLAVLGGPAAEPWLAAIACIAVIAVVTGALHLDGLADTADALVARDPAAAEHARKDPTLGVGGVLSLVLILATEIAALASLVETSGAYPTALVVVAVAATSRVVPVGATIVVARGRRRQEATLGSWFAERLSTTDVLLAGASVVVIVTILGAAGGGLVGVAALAAAISGLGMAFVIAALRGGLDGDGMGALVELSMVAGLVAAAATAA